MCNCKSSCGCDSIKLQRGKKGDPGTPGTAATIAIGDVTSLPAGSDPTVTNVGTATAAIFDFELVTGNDGVDGANAFTQITASFVMPAADGSSFVTVDVLSTAFMVVGQVVYVENAGWMRVATISNATQVILRNLENTATGVYAENVAPGTVVASGSDVSPGGLQGPFGPDGQAATIAVGSTSTGVPGSPAVVSNSGTPTAAIFDFTIPAGIAGTNGHTPVWTSSASAPTGGANGDVHIQQVNGGQIQFWYKDAGVWVAPATGLITSSRLLGYSTTNPTPNPSSLPANAGDSWWTQIGAVVTLWVYNGTSWATAVTFSTSGGGGSDTFQTVSDNSVGQLTGTRVWNMQRSIQYVVNLINTASSGATTQFNTDYAYHELTFLHAAQTINYTTPTAQRDCEWVFSLVNGTASPVTISYTAARWSKNPGVTHPTTLTAGEVAKLHCYYNATDGVMNVAFVEQNTTII